MYFQPMTIGQVLDNTFRSYRQNFGGILAFTLLFQGVLTFIIAFIPLITNWAEYAFFLFILLPPLYAVYAFLLMPVYLGGVTHCVFCQIHGTKCSFKDLLQSFKELVNKYAPTNALMILGVILMFMAFAVFIVVVALVSSISFVVLNSETTGIIAVTVVVLGAIALFSVLLLWVLLLFPIIEFEGIRNFAAIKRAIYLAYRKIWRLLGTVVLLSLIYFCIYLGLFSLIGFGALLFQTNAANWIALLLSTGFAVFNNLIAILLAPLFAILNVWLYLDIRARVDGEDLVLFLEQNGEDNSEFNIT